MTDVIRMERCTWCGAAGKTREHLIPQWLVRVLEEIFPSADGYDFKAEAVVEGEEPLVRCHYQQAPEIVVRAVCGTCNSGWMSELESKAKPAIERMVRGQQVRLHGAEQLTIAHWVAKSAVLLQHYYSESVVLGPTDKSQILAGSAPSGYLIRVAYRGGDDLPPFDLLATSHDLSPTSSKASERAIAPNSSTVTLGIGHLAISVSGGPGLDDPSRWSRPPSYPLTIWPPSPTMIEWPQPYRVLQDRGDLLRFHQELWAKVMNPDFKLPQDNCTVGDL